MGIEGRDCNRHNITVRSRLWRLWALSIIQGMKDKSKLTGKMWLKRNFWSKMFYNVASTVVSSYIIKRHFTSNLHTFKFTTKYLSYVFKQVKRVTLFSHLFTDTSPVPVLSEIGSEVQMHFLQSEYLIPSAFTSGVKGPLQLPKI